MHSREFEIGVLQWFARLWEIELDDFWGYITNCGTGAPARCRLPLPVVYAMHAGPAVVRSFEAPPGCNLPAFVGASAMPG